MSSSRVQPFLFSVAIVLFLDLFDELSPASARASADVKLGSRSCFALNDAYADGFTIISRPSGLPEERVGSCR